MSWRPIGGDFVTAFAAHLTVPSTARHIALELHLRLRSLVHFQFILL